MTVSARTNLPENVKHRRGRAMTLASWFGTIEVWVALSMLFTLLMRLSDDASGSKLWMLDPLLSVLFLMVKWGNQKFHWRARISLPRGASALLFLAIGWVFSMAYELSLSSSGTGYGGMHEKTIPSFILAQGSYIPLLLWALWLVRRYHLTFRELFFVAGMTCLYEAVFFGIPMMLSPLIVLSPMVFAYYFVIYSRFLSLGLLFVDEQRLWASKRVEISFGRKLAHGFIMGIGCWIFFVLWGKAMLYLFNDFEAFS
jgi:hypothetical protein